MTCTHHYLLESPAGSPTVTGTCKHCGHTRVYRVYQGDDDGGTWTERAAKQKRRSPVRGPLRNPDSYLRTPQTPVEVKALAKQEREWAQKAVKPPSRREKAQTATRVPRSPKTPRYSECVVCGKAKTRNTSARCLECAYPRREHPVCVDCGNPVSKASAIRCQVCARPPMRHGTLSGYSNGCRCEPCVEFGRAYWRAQNQLYRETSQQHCADCQARINRRATRCVSCANRSRKQAS